MANKGEGITDDQARNVMNFVVECIEAAYDGEDFDGEEIKELAIKYGLLIETEFDPGKHVDPEGEVEEGDPWFVKADFLKGIKP